MHPNCPQNSARGGGRLCAKFKECKVFDVPYVCPFFEYHSKMHDTHTDIFWGGGGRGGGRVRGGGGSMVEEGPWWGGSMVGEGPWWGVRDAGECIPFLDKLYLYIHVQEQPSIPSCSAGGEELFLGGENSRATPPV